MPNNIDEHVSCLQKLQLKYKGLERENTDEETTTSIIYQGSKELVEEAFVEMNTNGKDADYGNIETVRMYQDEGPFWNLEINYAIEKHGVGISSSKGSSYGPKASVLTVRAITRELETLSNYRMHWNNNLYCTKKVHSVPSWANNATFEDDKITGTSREYPGDGVTKPDSAEYYAWGKNLSELPPLLYGYTWHKVTNMTKPRS